MLLPAMDTLLCSHEYSYEGPKYGGLVPVLCSYNHNFLGK